MVPRFDLVDIVKTLQQKLRLIIVVTIVAALIGAVAFLVRKKQYKAKATFFVANPLYIDRTNLFRSEYSQFIDYFAKEDDVDKVMAIAKSDSLMMRVAQRLDLAKIYGKDLSQPKDRMKLLEIFDGNYEIKRTEYTSVEITYTDPDAGLATSVTNEIQKCISEMYAGYYGNLRAHVYNSLVTKVKETDSSIALMTDTLAALRERYKVYDLISPARKNIISGNIHSSSAGLGRGIEEIQNVEATKDRMVSDRAEYISVMNEFTAGNKPGDLPLIQSITNASVPWKPVGFGLGMTIVICALVGFFFITLWVLLSTYLRAVLNTER
jgi:hypothetical protein